MNEGYIGINLTRINVVSITDYHTIKRFARILLDVMTDGYICTIGYSCFTVIVRNRVVVDKNNENHCNLIMDCCA